MLAPEGARNSPRETEEGLIVGYKTRFVSHFVNQDMRFIKRVSVQRYNRWILPPQLLLGPLE